jgi:hypothetical protein
VHRPNAASIADKMLFMVASMAAEMERDLIRERTLDGTVALTADVLGQAELMRRRCRRVPASRSSLAGFRFPREVIVLAVRWYLRYGLSYRDVKELLAERGIEVDQVKPRSYTAL